MSSWQSLRVKYRKQDGISGVQTGSWWLPTWSSVPAVHTVCPVSYTHLDVYKRQGISHTNPQGAYYVLLDISEFGYASDLEFCDVLAREVGVGAVPGSSFFREPVNHLIRLHFAKKDETLNAALNRCLLYTSPSSPVRWKGHWTSWITASSKRSCPWAPAPWRSSSECTCGRASPPSRGVPPSPPSAWWVLSLIHI